VSAFQLTFLHEKARRQLGEECDIERLTIVDATLEVRGEVDRHGELVARRTLELRADLSQDDLDRGGGQ
jgi:hypothetical protein